MKKLALISGLLFLVVYLLVNHFTGDESSIEATYLPSSSSSPSAQVNDRTGVILTSSSLTAGGTGETYLIIASFNDPEKARKTADVYTAKYHADIFILPATPDGFYRISYGRYASAEDAGEALRDVKQMGFTDAWLLESK